MSYIFLNDPVKKKTLIYFIQWSGRKSCENSLEQSFYEEIQQHYPTHNISKTFPILLQFWNVKRAKAIFNPMMTIVYFLFVSMKYLSENESYLLFSTPVIYFNKSRGRRLSLINTPENPLWMKRPPPNFTPWRTPTMKKFSLIYRWLHFTLYSIR